MGVLEGVVANTSQNKTLVNLGSITFYIAYLLRFIPAKMDVKVPYSLKEKTLQVIMRFALINQPGALINLLSMFGKIVLTIVILILILLFSECPNEFIPSYSGMVATKFN